VDSPGKNPNPGYIRPRRLAGYCAREVQVSLYETIWRAHAALQCRIVTCLAFRNRLWTSERRSRHVQQALPSGCFTFLQDRRGHPRAHHSAVPICNTGLVILSANGGSELHIKEPSGIISFESWWSDARARVHRNTDKI
jgi:hypothetical protein